MGVNPPNGFNAGILPFHSIFDSRSHRYRPGCLHYLSLSAVNAGHARRPDDLRNHHAPAVLLDHAILPADCGPMASLERSGA